VKVRFVRFAVAAGALPLVFGACGSSATSSEPAATGTADPVSTCPSEAPPKDAKATVVLEGDRGKARVVPPTATTTPRVTVETPYQAKTTQVVRVHGGSGAALTDNAVVTVCYQGVNGRTGVVFDDSFARDTSAEFALTDVVPGFRKAITGQQVGSTVIASITGADGYPEGQPAAQIEPGDTLIFAITVLDAD
jgi:hypothetical protein